MDLVGGGKLGEKFDKQFNWPKNDTPILFLHFEGQEKLSKTNSKYNEDEANLVVLFLEKLLKLGIDIKDIGIIKPYNAQIDKIKSLIIKKNISNRNNLKISSVDGFQGGEKKFIILSNVRSNQGNNIGFLEDFRRLNVSITRAINGMIIIGNAKCLYKPKTVFRNFINYYLNNHLIYSPKVVGEKGEEKVFDIEDLQEFHIELLENIDLNEELFIYGKEEDYQDINQDLLENFECTSNVYAEGNKKYLEKKKEKKAKKYRKKYNK